MPGDHVGPSIHAEDSQWTPSPAASGCSRRAALVAVLLIAVLVAVVVVARAAWFGPAEGVADRIRAANSPIVEEVVLQGPNLFYGGESKVFVYLVPAATQEQALSLWCDVVLPAGAAQAYVRLVKNQMSPTPVFVSKQAPVCPAGAP